MALTRIWGGLVVKDGRPETPRIIDSETVLRMAAVHALADTHRHRPQAVTSPSLSINGETVNHLMMPQNFLYVRFPLLSSSFASL